MNRKKISRFDYAKVQYYFDIAKKFVKILTHTPIPPTSAIFEISNFKV